MSTIQSSADHVIINADGSSKDIKFQANGVEKASISSAGAFTSTTIDATKLTGNLPAISGANLTGISGSSDYRPSGKPIIINGDMAISQRSTSVASLGNSDSGYHTVDRWNYSEPTSGHITSVDVWTQTQETLTSGAAWQDGFTKALKMDCTTASASPGTDHAAIMEYKIEGADVKAFKKGTPNAQPYTLAFWVKATKTGTNCVNLFDKTNDRYIAAAYTISTTNTWEKKVINFAADTTGSIAAGSYYQGENGEGMKLTFSIYAGTGYTSSSLQTSWGSATTAARFSGQVNNADSTSNNWHITGVQLEVGTYTAATLPPFQHESFGDSLARCKRYYEKTYAYATAVGHSDTSGDAAIGFHVGFMQENKTGTGMEVSLRPFMVEKRANPTVVIYSLDGQSGKWTRWTTGWGVASHTTGLANELAATGFKVTVNAGTSSNGALGHWTADSEL